MWAIRHFLHLNQSLSSRPVLNERRTRGFLEIHGQEIRGISLVFREMWDTTALNPALSDQKRPSLLTPNPVLNQLVGQRALDRIDILRDVPTQTADNS
jgi:hypothetical protein